MGNSKPEVRGRSRRQEWSSIPLRIILPVALTVVLFVLTIFLLILPALEASIMERKREMIRELTRSAWSDLAHFGQQESAGLLSRDAAQAEAIDHVRNLRYGPENKDYFWISDMDSRVIMHPYRPDLNGTNGSLLVDPKGKHFVDEFSKIAREQGAGYVDYMWQWKDDPSRVVPKISYVKAYEPWGWIVGTGIYTEDVRTEIASLTRKLSLICLGILAVIAILSSFIIWEGMRAEKQLRQLNIELEQRVADRTAELQRSHAVVEEKNVMLGKTVGELREREQLMAQELKLAQEVQQHFLPKVFPFGEELRFAAMYQSSLTIGGDLYDAFRISDRLAGFYIADASGHGVSAALITAVLKVSFERFRRVSSPPAGLGESAAGAAEPLGDSASLASFMESLNQALHSTVPESTFVTFLVGVLRLDSGELLLANAGHDSPVWYNQQARSAQLLPLPSNFPLGLAMGGEYEIVQFQLQPGDKLIAYTDGLTELMDASGKEFGLQSLLDAVQAYGHLEPEALLSEITKKASAFAGSREPHDDQAILVIDYRKRRTTLAPSDA